MMNQASQTQLPTIAYFQSQQEQHRSYPMYAMYPSILTTIKEISCGYNFTLLLDTNMRVYSFGGNQHGQLGYESQASTVSQIRSIPLSKKFSIEGIRCGFTHAVVFGDKQCFGWGQHQYGALGYEPTQVINTWMPRKLPILISPHQQLLDVSCGNNTTIFNISNKFYCLGDNRLGQLGLILKKPSFEPEKLQIETNKYPKPSKLVSVKAGDGFTIGMDEHHQLFGAGQVAKLGLCLRNKNILPAGVGQLEMPTKNGYDMVINVAEYECRQNLRVKFLGDEGRSVVFGSKQGTLQKILGNEFTILGQNHNIVLLQNGQKLYKWQLEGIQSNQTQHLSMLAQGQMKIDLVGCEVQGRIIVIDNHPAHPCQPKLNPTNGIKKEEYQQNTKMAPVLAGKQQSKNGQIQNLVKQVRQQKEIIRLFEQYVAKLEDENAELKEQLLQASSALADKGSDDIITNNLFLLKLLLKNMLQE